MCILSRFLSTYQSLSPSVYVLNYVFFFFLQKADIQVLVYDPSELAENLELDAQSLACLGSLVGNDYLTPEDLTSCM